MCELGNSQAITNRRRMASANNCRADREVQFAYQPGAEQCIVQFATAFTQ